MTNGSQQSPQADGTGIGAPILLLGATVSMGIYYASRLAPGQLQHTLETRPRLMLAAAGLLVLPVLLFGFFDFWKARERSYQPPSLRVQISRSFTYGVLLSAANVLLVLGLRPELLRILVQQGIERASFLAVLVPLYGAGSWVVCFRRRQFIVDELLPFRDAASALRGTYDFILGRAGTDWKTGAGDPRWFVLPERALFTNLYCLGGIGSGKTSSVAYPILEQALYKFPGDSAKKIGVFLLDAKGDNAKYVLERARAHGREKDVVILKPGGDFSYNPLGSGTPTAVANKLVAALEVMTDQQSNSYYKKMQREFAENALQVLGDVLGPGRASMMDLYDFITDQKVQKKYVDAAAATNSIAYRWFTNQWAKEDPKEQMMLTKGFRADLSSFVRDDMAPTFAPSNPTFPGWENLIDDGKVVVFSMSLDEYGEFARAMGIFVLMDFQNVMLSRTTTKFKEAGHNTDRLCMCFIDECWAYMNPKLADFTSVSRQAKCCTLALHQSLGQIRDENMRQTMLGNFRTPIILNINDLLSLATFSELFGTHKVLRKSKSESSGFSGVERQILSDGMTARAGGESKSLSISETEVDEPRFSQDEILRLPRNRAVVQMFDGDNTLAPTVVETIRIFDTAPDGSKPNLLA